MQEKFFLFCPARIDKESFEKLIDKVSESVYTISVINYLYFFCERSLV